MATDSSSAGRRSELHSGCHECGAPLADDQRYCVECGERRGAFAPALAAFIASPGPSAVATDIHGADADCDDTHDSEPDADADTGEKVPAWLAELSSSVAALSVIVVLAFGV